MKRFFATFLFAAYCHIASGSPGGSFGCGAQWQCSASEDKMESSTMELAILQSKNALTLGFPYQKDDNRGRLTFRSAKGDGLKLFIQIGAGQFTCTLGCNLRIKFDDEKPLIWSANAPSDGTSTVIFLSNPRGFFQRMKKSRKLLIEPNPYRESGQVLEFEPQGLTIR